MRKFFELIFVFFSFNSRKTKLMIFPQTRRSNWKIRNNEIRFDEGREVCVLIIIFTSGKYNFDGNSPLKLYSCIEFFVAGWFSLYKIETKMWMWIEGSQFPKEISFLILNTRKIYRICHNEFQLEDSVE